MEIRLLGSAALAALFAFGSAHAADLPPPTAAPVYKAPAMAPAFSWTGFYVGVDGGYGFGRSTGTLANATGGSGVPYAFNTNGGIAGGFVGGNYQFGQLVVGAEFDWQWADLTGNSGAVTSPANAPTLFTMSSKVKDYGSARGRLGFAIDHWLLYGTGGWAFGNWSTSYGFAGAAPILTDNVSSSRGWTAGAGVEYAFTNSVIGRVEYRYTDLGSATFTSTATNSSELGNRITINDVRAGLSYKFP
jgi:outer membrane immunogenic protein